LLGHDQSRLAIKFPGQHQFLQVTAGELPGLCAEIGWLDIENVQ
jgi:hypothetical protein